MLIGTLATVFKSKKYFFVEDLIIDLTFFLQMEYPVPHVFYFFNTASSDAPNNLLVFEETRNTVEPRTVAEFTLTVRSAINIGCKFISSIVVFDLLFALQPAFSDLQTTG